MSKEDERFTRRRGRYHFSPDVWGTKTRKCCRLRSPEDTPQAPRQRSRKDGPVWSGSRSWRAFRLRREAEARGFQLVIKREKPKIPKRVLLDEQEEKLWEHESR